MSVDDDDTLREILALDTIAVVGCSTSETKAAHTVPKYMREHGYRIVPVNPYADEIFGRRAYDTLSEVEGDVDIVDVFRPTNEVPGIVDEAVGREEVDTIWLQLGITHDEAAQTAEEAGKRVVQDRCLRVEHQRLVE